MTEIAGAIAEYFGDAADQAVITEAWSAEHGWREFHGQATLATVKALRTHRGVTAVAVAAAGRTADFDVDQVLAYANRPLFGGRVI